MNHKIENFFVFIDHDTTLMLIEEETKIGQGLLEAFHDNGIMERITLGIWNRYGWDGLSWGW